MATSVRCGCSLRLARRNAWSLHLLDLARDPLVQGTLGHLVSRVLDRGHAALKLVRRGDVGRTVGAVVPLRDRWGKADCREGGRVFRRGASVG